MVRLFLIIAIIVVVYLLFRRLYNRAAPPPAERSTEDMVRCAHCGVHIPRSEAISTENRFYCSAEHRDAAQH